MKAIQVQTKVLSNTYQHDDHDEDARHCKDEEPREAGRLHAPRVELHCPCVGMSSAC